MPQQCRPQQNQSNGKVPWLSSRRPKSVVMLSQLVGQTPQRPALPSTGITKHDAGRPKTNYALTNDVSDPMGALQMVVQVKI